MLFEYFSFEATALQIAAGTQTGDTGTDDDYFFLTSGLLQF